MKADELSVVVVLEDMQRALPWGGAEANEEELEARLEGTLQELGARLEG